MIISLLSKFKRRFQRRAIVLMYHRIANLESDPWQLAVSPENFEQHLQHLKKSFKVISISELVRQLNNKKLEQNSVCITFDDAYEDNYLFAKPLLEKYNLPATFFVASDYIGNNQPFWWDELEKIILHSKKLPLTLSINIGYQIFHFKLDKESLSEEDDVRHRSWVWEDAHPTRRSQLYLALWKRLKPLKTTEIENVLIELRKWASYTQRFNTGDMAMNHTQLKELYTNSLFTIGLHTLSHPALAFHTHDIQTQEIEGCKNALENISGLKINWIAYPYGSFNDVTLSVASEQNLSAGFTTRAEVIYKSSNPLSLGRFQVVNLNSKDFKRWCKSNLNN